VSPAAGISRDREDTHRRRERRRRIASQAATAAGCDVVLAKPCSQVELLRAIEQLLAKPA